MTLDFVKLSPTKNITILVTSRVEKSKRAAISAKLMQADFVGGEQVGFLVEPVNPDSDARLEMMGGEFCANATMATASYIARQQGRDKAAYSVEVSGCPEPLKVKVERDGLDYLSTVPMPLPATKSEIELPFGVFPIIHLTGISHILLPYDMASEFSHESIKAISDNIDSEAVGLLFYSKGVMRPFVYVKPTDTAVWESACGSGTAAIGAFQALENGINESWVSQPGGVIRVNASVEAGKIATLSITGKTRATVEGRAYI